MEDLPVPSFNDLFLPFLYSYSRCAVYRYIYIYGLFPLDFLFLEKEKGKPLHRERFMAALFLDLAQLYGFTLTAYEFYSPPGLYKAHVTS